MKNNKKIDKNNYNLVCYISSFINNKIDKKLEEHGISKGVVSFSIPNYGIQFRCRTGGMQLEMEFIAFFSLLEFIKTKLKDEKIRKVHVVSSLPHFVFAFTGGSDFLKNNSSYRNLFLEYSKVMTISIGYIKSIQNDALKSPILHPSLPKDKEIKIDIPDSEMFKTEFKSIQKGISF